MSAHARSRSLQYSVGSHPTGMILLLALLLGLIHAEARAQLLISPKLMRSAAHRASRAGSPHWLRLLQGRSPARVAGIPSNPSQPWG